MARRGRRGPIRGKPEELSAKSCSKGSRGTVNQGWPEEAVRRGNRSCREAEGRRPQQLAVVAMAEEAMAEEAMQVLQGYMDSRMYHRLCISHWAEEGSCRQSVHYSGLHDSPAAKTPTGLTT